MRAKVSAEPNTAAPQMTKSCQDVQEREREDLMLPERVDAYPSGIDGPKAGWAPTTAHRNLTTPSG